MISVPTFRDVRKIEDRLAVLEDRMDSFPHKSYTHPHPTLRRWVICRLKFEIRDLEHRLSRKLHAQERDAFLATLSELRSGLSKDEKAWVTGLSSSASMRRMEMLDWLDGEGWIS